MKKRHKIYLISQRSSNSYSKAFTYVYKKISKFYINSVFGENEYGYNPSYTIEEFKQTFIKPPTGIIKVNYE